MNFDKRDSGAGSSQQPAESKACASVGVEPDFWAWVNLAYRDAKTANFTIYNMEVAYQAGRASPAPSVGEPAWMTAFDDARDAILHGRDALEGVLDNDQTNAVLSVLDDYFMPFLRRGATPPAAPAATEAPSDGDPSENLRKWAYEACKLLGGEDHEVRDRLRTALAASWAASKSALATPAPAAPASVQPVLASLSELQKEAAELSRILAGMGEGGYDLETLYTDDQADGDAFVKRAADVLAALARREN